MDFIFTDGQDDDFAHLCVLLDESLEKLAGHVIDRSQYSRYNTREKIHDVVLAYDGPLPVACGSFRHYDHSTAEIKRVFVREDYRGRGISKTIMSHLEKRALEKGYTVLILETGAPLVRSIGLYQSLGFEITDNYEPYIGMIHSFCMRKMLKPALTAPDTVTIREAIAGDLAGILMLYAQFKSTPISQTDEYAEKIWHSMMSDRHHHIIVADDSGQLVSTCVLLVIPNLTHDGRPYALIENVITDEKARSKGYATVVLNYARAIAIRENCYKIMLMTGSKFDSTLQFYERAGYNRNDKTAFIQWL